MTNNKWTILFHGYDDLITEWGGVKFSSAEVLQMLSRRIGNPSSFVSWYLTDLIPARNLQGSGAVTIYGGFRFVGENLEAAPSMYLYRFGFWTIGRDLSGDALVVVEPECTALWLSPEHFSGRKAHDLKVIGYEDINAFRSKIELPTRLDELPMFSERFDTVLEALQARL